MEKAVISFRGADLCAWEKDGRWTVKLGAFEASARYLDLALAAVLDDGEAVHELAAKLVAELANTRSVGADQTVAA
jgi:hypothetical protein